MKLRIFPAALALSLLCACGPAAPAEEEGLKLVATTYPIYLLANTLCQGAEDITVERLNTGSVSCLHDYTLSVTDMKKLEGAALIALNGVGLDEFLHDALAASPAAMVDCSRDVELLEAQNHHHEEGEEDGHGHDHGHFDPHYWMDPAQAARMVAPLSEALMELDPGRADLYAANAAAAQADLEGWDRALRGMAEGVDCAGLITFHDGFQYFAHAFGLPLLESIEEEAGSEASAREIVEISELVNEGDIPVIFTEVNGSDATAKAISRETGCTVARLSMLMDGEGRNLNDYYEAQRANLDAILEGFAQKEDDK